MDADVLPYFGHSREGNLYSHGASCESRSPRIKQEVFMLFKNRQLYIANSTLILALLGRKPYTPHMRINARCEQVVLSMEVK